MSNPDYDKILTSIAKTLLGFLVAIAICAMLPSCKRVEYVTVPEYHSDTITTLKLQRDSVYVKDSVYVTKETKGDTVYLTRDRWHIAYRDKLKIDTAYISKTDSVPVVKVVEKQLTKWEKLKINLGGVIMGIGVAVIGMIVLLLWKIFKK